ncbi:MULTISPECIES: pyridoxamine 5'-phosphate oxidase family protein [unclassified Aureimonas]|uniref:pyridoxamine 5'-phosphate oxidase family protein n=1 Tax=unclassified Aureimonas TaxID=2615206 RepID=UPI0006F53870|nr:MULTISPECIES: pyridoxamine 5'-phosphate oxidase family protein [unclassified Aureimonas]KQT52860.1 pyridoxamine 5'-phosphate oxidase [Aureimonas sp. Leaf427]KQT80319.1 pyridoxamine 5'-phosphate oxidase [Aureimonas sp. Leaf460]
MSDMTLHALAKAMKDIDFCMLSTRAASGDIAARPMSNNGDVEYDGDSYFFTYEEAHTVADIERDRKVGLGFQGSKGLLGKPPLFISVEGEAELIRDKAAFEAHWTSDLDYWFKDGIDTPGIVLIKVHATRVHYWDGKHEGEIKI